MAKTKFYISSPSEGTRCLNQSTKDVYESLKIFLTSRDDTVLIIAKQSAGAEAIKGELSAAVDYAKRDL